MKEHADPEAWAQNIVEEMNREAQGGKQQIIGTFFDVGKPFLFKQQ